MASGAEQDLPAVIPIFPLTGAIVLPQAQLPLNIFEPRYLAMVRDAMAGARIIGMVQPLRERIYGASGGPPPEVYGVGCAGRITQFSETGDGRLLITLTGLCRFRIAEELAATTPYRQIRPDFAAFAGDRAAPAALDPALRASLTSELQAYLDLQGLGADWHAVETADDATLVDLLSMILPFAPEEKQALLEAPAIAARAEALIALLRFTTRAAIEPDPGTRH